MVKLTPSDPALKIPQMGWNELDIVRDRIRCSTGIAQGAHAYFVHSYAMKTARCPTTCWRPPTMAAPLTAVVGRDNIAGTQFHPEKSQAVGLDAARQFPGVAAMIIFPAIDLKDGAACG